MDIDITDPIERERVALANDEFRRIFDEDDVEWLTEVDWISPYNMRRILDAVRNYRDNSDPYLQRSFAFINVAGVSYIAFIQVYGIQTGVMEIYDPTSLASSRRMMMIMRDDADMEGPAYRGPVFEAVPYYKETA